MRASGILFRLAKALVDATPAGTACSRLQCVEALSRMPHGAASPCSTAASAAARRPFAAAAVAEAHGSGDDAELQPEWEYGSQRTAHKLVTDRPRTLDDFEDIIAVLIRRRRAYKIRDVFEEMDLCGVPPAALTYFRVIFACMKARRLGDTLYYWHRMQRAGIVPDSRTYGVVISAAGRAGQTEAAVKLMDEMRRKGLKPTKNTYLAALNALAETARVDESWALLEEMTADGIPPDEFAYTALINGYKRARPAPADVEARMDDLLQRCRDAESMDFSRRRKGGLGIVAYNAALNTFCELGFHDRAVAMFEAMPAEGLVPDYDSYSAIILSYLKESVRAYRQFAISHPGGQAHMELLDDQGGGAARLSVDPGYGQSFEAVLGGSAHAAGFGSHAEDSDGEAAASPRDVPGGTHAEASALQDAAGNAANLATGGPDSSRPPSSRHGSGSSPRGGSQGFGLDAGSAAANAAPPLSPREVPTYFEPAEVAPEYAHLHISLARHLTRLKARVNREAWAKVIEVYNDAARRGLSLSPGVYYDLMRTAVLMANAGETEALGFAEHCLQEMSALGMFLNTQNGSTILAACSRKELPMALPFAHRLWDVLVLNGRVPKTNAIKAYLRALQEREPQWVDRISQVKRVAAIDPGRLRSKSGIVGSQKPGAAMAQRKAIMAEKEARMQDFHFAPDASGGAQEPKAAHQEA